MPNAQAAATALQKMDMLRCSVVIVCFENVRFSLTCGLTWDASQIIYNIADCFNLADEVKTAWKDLVLLDGDTELDNYLIQTTAHLENVI